jgi:hypothetical protein
MSTDSHANSCPKQLNDAAVCDCRDNPHERVSPTKCSCGAEFELRVELREHIYEQSQVEETVN